MTNKDQYGKILRRSICFFIVFPLLLGIGIAFYNLPEGYYLTKILFLISVLTSTGAMTIYLTRRRSGETLLSNFYIPYVLIAGCAALAFLPMLVKPFLYHDDLWCYTGKYTNQISAGIGFSRPFWGIVWAFLAPIKYENSNVARMISCMILVLFALCCYKWIAEKSGNSKIAVFFAILACAGVSSMDLIGYLSIYPVGLGLLFGALSVIFYDLSTEKKDSNPTFRRLILCILSWFSLFSAFNFYQVGTPVVALFLAIYIIHTRTDIKKILFYVVKYALIFSTAALSHLGYVKLMRMQYSITLQEERGQIISTFSEIIHKVLWFGSEVVPQTLNRIVSIIFGKHIFNQNCLFYLTSYKSKFFGYFCYFILLAVVLFLFIYLIRKRQLVKVSLLLLLIPFSFYTFLILPDSLYITYYAFPLLLVLLYYFLTGAYTLFNMLIPRFTILKPNPKFKLFIGAAVCFVVVLNSYLYADQFWVEYNQASRQYTEAVLANSVDIVSQIHMYGTPAPIQSDVYARFLVESCIREQGGDPNNYKITVSRDEYLKDTLDAAEYDQIVSSCSKEDLDFFNKWYHPEHHYLTDYHLAEPDLLQLQGVFRKAGLIPGPEEDVLIVDLRFMSKLYSFQ